MKNTARLITALRKRIVLAALLEETVTGGLTALSCLLLFSLADYAFLLPGRLLKLPVWAACAAAVYVAVRVVLRCRPCFRSNETTLVHVQERAPELGDELLSAWQLSRAEPAGVSPELVGALIEKMEAAAAKLDVSRLQPLLSAGARKTARYFLAVLGVFAVLYALPPGITRLSCGRILFALSSAKWNTYFALAPGDRSLPYGSPAEITIEGKQILGGEPALWVRSDNGRWRKAALAAAGGRTYVFAVDQVCGKISYRAEWADIASPVFTLVPVMYPQLGDFSVTCQYPSYTGLAPQEIKGSAAITAIAGTRITVTARSTKELKGAALKKSWQGESKIETDGDRVTARFTLSESGTYRIEAEANDGTRDPDPAEYPVSVTKDAPPAIELLSPAEDLVVSPQAEIPLVGEARDDFGLAKVELVYRIDAQNARRIVVVPAESGVSQKSFEYLWRIGELNARPGAKIQYYLEAWDNDTHAGPKSAATPARLVEITDYEREHDAIEGDLRGVKEKLLGILADQNAAKERTKSLETAFSTASWRAVTESQRAVKANMQAPLAALKKALARMENDPLTDLGTLSEYRGLASYLERLSNGPMTDAPKALEEKDLARAGKDQDEIIASLEKLSLLSEDIWQNQKMRDVLDAGSELKDASARLKERLAGGAKPEDLKAALDRIDELMGKISRQVTKFPKELPEDFVNSPAVKQIPMGTYEDQAKRLREALDRGDWQTAKALAAQLDEGLESMLNTLEEAGRNSDFAGGSSEAMQKQVRDYTAGLDELQKKQTALQQRIEEMDGIRQKTLFAEQEKMLAELARKQKELTARAEALKGRSLARLSPYYLVTLDQSLVLMRKVLGEFSEKRVFHSQKYLEDIIAHLSDQGRIVAAGGTQDAEFRKYFAGENASLSAGEKEILDALRKTPEQNLFTPAQEESLKGLAAGEDGLSGETDRFRKDLEEFTRKSASLDAGIFDNVSRASAEMKGAGSTLRQADTKGGREHGQKALDYLSEMRKSLNAAAEGMAGQGKQPGKGGPGRIRVKGGGSTGFKSVPVKLPRINEYKPPREFRQEILDALKEKYPKQYDKIIKEYFKKLTE